MGHKIFKSFVRIAKHDSLLILVDSMHKVEVKKE